MIEQSLQITSVYISSCSRSRSNRHETVALSGVKIYSQEVRRIAVEVFRKNQIGWACSVTAPQHPCINVNNTKPYRLKVNKKKYIYIIIKFVIK